jgi:hypothetical protein
MNGSHDWLVPKDDQFNQMIDALVGPGVLFDRAYLEAEIRRIGLQDTNEMNIDPDGNPIFFTLGPVDWSFLDVERLAPEESILYADMAQSLRDLPDDTTDPRAFAHGCVVNAVRFALQRKFDVMIGTMIAPHRSEHSGDPVVWSLLKDAFVLKDFNNSYKNSPPVGTPKASFTQVWQYGLHAARVWAPRLGISAESPVLSPDLKQVVDALQFSAPNRNLLFVAGRVGRAGHMYVIYDKRMNGQVLEIMAYDPWWGRNAHLESDPVAQPRSNWMPLTDFQQIMALPVSQDEQTFPTEGPVFYQSMSVNLRP